MQKQTVAHTLSAEVMYEFNLQGKRHRHFSPLANSCFRQNNKRLNDTLSCPLWFQRGNGTASRRQQLQMAHLCLSAETLAHLKDRLIPTESVFKRQSADTSSERTQWRRANEKPEKIRIKTSANVIQDGWKPIKLSGL